VSNRKCYEIDNAKLIQVLKYPPKPRSLRVPLAVLVATIFACSLISAWVRG
jgi:hypothetical protein